VWGERKRIEKLQYMHRNPVKRGLVQEPEQWKWSSYRSYALGEEGMVKINLWPKAVMKIRRVASISDATGEGASKCPPFAQIAKDAPPAHGDESVFLRPLDFK